MFRYALEFYLFIRASNEENSHACKITDIFFVYQIYKKAPYPAVCGGIID